jgi:hypothetical protein
MITPEQHAEIRRLYFGEHWKVGTIVANLGVHPDTVRAAIALDTRVVRRGACRRSILDPYLPFIRDTLAQYPRLRATRLYEMLRPRGYGGSANHLRRLVRLLRPQQSWCRGLGESEEVLGVARSDSGRLAARLQLLQAILADRLQHREAVLTV